MLEIKQKGRKQKVSNGRKLNPVIRTLRNIILTIVILGGLLVGGAVAYTWYNGKYGEAPKAVSALQSPKPASSTGPHTPSPTAVVGVATQFLSSSVKPGDNATISIHTNAGANCTIKVEYNKVPAKDSGLIPQKADAYGLVSWTWTVPTTAPVGKWPITVTCANLKNSGVGGGDLVVSKDATPAPSN